MTAQNKELIDKLMSNQASQPTIKTLQKNDNKIDKNDIITANRIVGVRYKIYSMILILVSAILVYNYLMPAIANYNITKNKLNDLKNQTALFETRKKKFEQETLLIQKVKSQENSIVNYLNTGEGYDKLDPIIKNNLNIVKSYLQLTSLYSEKMPINETVLLANINEFLLKIDKRKRNGVLNKLSIGEPELISKNFYLVPIELNVTFDNKDGLLSFIKNVEEHILPDSKYRVLYKINEISYDIVNYTQKQDVDISLSAYYIR